MPVASQTAHRTLKNPVMPYVTFSSPVSLDPQMFAGHNVMTSIQAIVERYPGFAASIESAASVFAAPNKVMRLFAWKKWDTASTTGSYYWMACVTNTVANTSRVYKLEVGRDVTFQQIHQDTNSSSPFDFTVGNNTCFFGNNTTQANMRAYDGVTGTTNTRLWGIAAPTVDPTIGAISASSTLTAYVGYVYFYTYCNSQNSHESSPSGMSACTGLFTNSAVPVGVTASGDSQVDQIRVYRSTDGGSQAPEDAAEIANSPFANANQTITDVTPDASLGLRFAPAALSNDPPPPANGYAQFSNRIWMKSGNRVYYTGFEEITNGVEEECVPSGADGNFFPYPNQVNGLAGLDSLVAIATSDAIYGIDGDSLDTFRRYTVSIRNGVKSSTNIATISLEPGTVLAGWLDTSGTVWMVGPGEIGLPIRPDLATIDQLQSSVCFHINQEQRWFLILDAAGGRLFTYDLDTKLWMPPRLITAYSIASGETTAGNYDLVLGHNSGKVLKMTPGNYNDNGTTYTASLTTNLFEMTPAGNPQRRAVCDYISVESDAVQPSAVTICTDDDPRTAGFIPPTATVDADLRTQGIDIVEKYYKFNTPVARRVAFKLDWPAADQNFQVYGLDIALHPTGM